MLERATGCLESGSLRRLLPASRSSVKSRRTLHSGFWSHGASDDISTLWTVLVRGPESLEQQHREKHRMGPAAASSNTGLLDFLYPTAALNLIRRYSSWGVERQESNWTRSWLGKAAIVTIPHLPKTMERKVQGRLWKCLSQFDATNYLSRCPHSLREIRTRTGQ